MRLEKNWTVEDNLSWRPCPTHDKEAKCILISRFEGDDVYKVKLHGSYWLASNGKPHQFDTVDSAMRNVDELLAQLDFRPAPSKPTAQSTGEQKPIMFTVDPYSYNMFQVIVQGTPWGPYVLVNSPRFGPLNPDQAINLAAWLRKYAEECGNLTKTFEQIWNSVKES